MTIPRKNIVDKSSSGFYHRTTRCVRRAFLCGDDPWSGENYDHRREWIRSRLLVLESIFAADLYAYAVMSNHYHVVLFMDVDRARSWSDEEVARRWLTLCPPRTAVNENPEAPNQAGCFDNFVRELAGDAERIALYRKRLCDLSWLMRFLNEYIARKANREDRTKGRFWEGRFKTQALLDEGAVLACMAYVDLNPIRAGIAVTPEESEFTSVKQRLECVAAGGLEEKTLTPVTGTSHSDDAENAHIHTARINAIALRDYLQLVDWTGRQIREGKTGRIPDHLGPILERLGLDSAAWTDTARGFGRRFGIAAGHWDRIRAKAFQTGRHWLHGVGASRQAYRVNLTACT